MDAEPSPVFLNGHKLLFDARTSRLLRRPIMSCTHCGARSDTERSTRQCLGTSAHLLGYSGRLVIPVTVEPRGRRKPFDVEAELRLEALAELGTFLQGLPPDGLAHAYNHWANPDSPYPCTSCQTPEGEALRTLEEGKANAIDTEFLPPHGGELPGPGSGG